MENNNPTILIVDDEPINLEIICAHLEDDGYTLITASNGDEAWARIESAPGQFDAIILDRMMPEMDGMQVLANIKDNDLLAQVPVVMQTARAENQEVVEGLRAGA